MAYSDHPVIEGPMFFATYYETFKWVAALIVAAAIIPLIHFLLTRGQNDDKRPRL